MLIKRYYTILSDIFANFYQLQIKHVMLERQLLAELSSPYVIK